MESRESLCFIIPESLALVSLCPHSRWILFPWLSLPGNSISHTHQCVSMVILSPVRWSTTTACWWKWSTITLIHKNEGQQSQHVCENQINHHSLSVETKINRCRVSMNIWKGVDEEEKQRREGPLTSCTWGWGMKLLANMSFCCDKLTPKNNCYVFWEFKKL